MFSGENVGVFGGTNIANSPGGTVNIQSAPNLPPSRDSKAFKNLWKNVASGALHDSGEVSDPPKCHPGTRIAVLETMMTFAIAVIYAFPIRWLNGPAGAGKSAIMRTFADMLAHHGLLLASFFFFRSDGNRNNTQYLISTIAFQLCRNIPPIKPHIEHAIAENPLIFTSAIWSQIQTLIVEPLLRFFYDPNSITITPFPRVILIDGLDECHGQGNQSEILEALCRMVRTLPIPLAIVVASRPETHIRSAFDIGLLNQTHSRISLDNTFEPDKDIRAFYVSEFERLRKNHPMNCYLSDLWPAPDVIDRLVENASGQFIYASTIIKFISSTRHNPSARLMIVLGMADRGTSKPFQQLDLLYATIFLNIDSEDLPVVLRLLGIILTPSASTSHAYQSPEFLEALLGFQQSEVRRLLLDLASLLTVTGDRFNIRIFHTSFSDFLFDKPRAGDLSVDKGRIYADIAQLCLERALQPHDCNMLQYIYDRFPICLRRANPTKDLLQTILSFDLQKLINLKSTKDADILPSLWCPDYGLRILAPMFLNAVRTSSFPDAGNLYTTHLLSFGNLIRPQFLLYIDNEALLALLVLVITINPDTRLATLFLQAVGLVFTPEIIRLDQEDGFHIKRNHDKTYGEPFITLVRDCMESSGALMASETVRIQCTNLAVCLLQRLHCDPSQYTEATRLAFGANGNFSQVEMYLTTVMSGLLKHSLVREDLTNIITQLQLSENKFYTLAARAIEPYLERVRTESMIQNAVRTAIEALDTNSPSSQVWTASSNEGKPSKDTQGKWSLRSRCARTIDRIVGIFGKG